MRKKEFEKEVEKIAENKDKFAQLGNQNLSEKITSYSVMIRD